MPSTLAPPAAELKTMLVDDITVVAGFNHRHTFDDEQMQELIDSIAESGVLQPLLVNRKGELVAGERRLRASKAAGLVDVPVQVVDIEGTDAKLASIAENMIRADVAPIEQAEAFAELLKDPEMDTHEKLAKRLKVSTQLVSGRLRLLALGDLTRGYINTRKLPLITAQLLTQIAEHGVDGKPGMQIADACAKVLLSDQPKDGAREFKVHDFLNEPGQVLDFIERNQRHYKLFLYDIDQYNVVRSLSNIGCFTPKQLERIELQKKRVREAPGYKHVAFPNFTEADIDAARAFGCLLELVTDEESARFVTDKAWLKDRATDLVIRYQQAVDAEIKPAVKVSTPKGELTAKQVKEQEERRKELAAKKERARKVYSSNTAIGARLKTYDDRKPLTLHQAQLIACECLSGSDDVQLGLGMVRAFEDWHEQKVNEKSGIVKHTWPEKPEAADKLVRWVLSGDCPEQVLNRLSIAMVAAMQTKDDQQPSKVRGWYSLPTHDLEYRMKIKGTLGKLVEQFLPKAKGTKVAQPRTSKGGDATMAGKNPFPPKPKPKPKPKGK